MNKFSLDEALQIENRALRDILKKQKDELDRLREIIAALDPKEADCK